MGTSLSKITFIGGSRDPLMLAKNTYEQFQMIGPGSKKMLIVPESDSVLNIRFAAAIQQSFTTKCGAQIVQQSFEHDAFATLKNLRAWAESGKIEPTSSGILINPWGLTNATPLFPPLSAVLVVSEAAGNFKDAKIDDGSIFIFRDILNNLGCSLAIYLGMAETP